MRAFERLGWSVARQTGSHVILDKAGHRNPLSIPKHAGRDVSRVLLSKLLKAAGVTEDEYRQAYRR